MPRCCGHAPRSPASGPGLSLQAHAERIGKRPVHCRRDLAGGAHRQRTNVLMLGRKRERPSLPEHGELLWKFLGAAISLDPVSRRRAQSLVWWDYIDTNGPVARAGAGSAMTTPSSPRVAMPGSAEVSVLLTRLYVPSGDFADLLTRQEPAIGRRS
jgi:hypothetical protein